MVVAVTLKGEAASVPAAKVERGPLGICVVEVEDVAIARSHGTRVDWHAIESHRDGFLFTLRPGVVLCRENRVGRDVYLIGDLESLGRSPLHADGAASRGVALAGAQVVVVWAAVADNRPLVVRTCAIVSCFSFQTGEPRPPLLSQRTAGVDSLGVGGRCAARVAARPE